MSRALRWLEGRRAFEEGLGGWDELLVESGRPHPFLRSDWLRAWLAAFGAGRRPLLALLEEDGRPLAGWPLAIGPGRIGRWRVRKLELAGAPWFDRIELPARDERVARRFLAGLLDDLPSLGGWTALELRELERGGREAAWLEELAAERGMPLDVRVCSRAPLIDFALAGAAGGRPSKNLRSQLRRGRKRLEERGGVAMAFEAPATEQALALLEECREVGMESWKRDSPTWVLREGPPLEFVRALVRSRAAEGGVLFATLRLEGRLVAYHWGWRAGARFLSYDLCHRASLDACGPGTLLVQHMIESAPMLGLAVLDASRGDLRAPHLFARYGGPLREHVQLVGARPGLGGAAFRLARRGAAAWRRARRGATAAGGGA